MEEYGGVYRIPCVVNGAKMKFIFDTGASSVSISQTMAMYLYDNDMLKDEDILGTGKSSVADGRIVDHVNVILRDVEIAGLHLKDVKAVVSSSLSAPLLLGQTAIQQLGTFTLDGNVLTINNASSNKKKVPSTDETIEIYKRAKEYREMGLRAAELEEFEKIDVVARMVNNTLLEYADCCSANEQYTKAKQLYIEWIDKFGNEADDFTLSMTYTSLGLAYFCLDDYKNCVLNYQKALRYDNSNSVTYQALGQAHYYYKRYREAIEQYEIAASILIQEIQTDAAKKSLLDKGLYQDENLADISYDLAQCYRKIGQNDMWFANLRAAADFGHPKAKSIINASGY